MSSDVAVTILTLRIHWLKSSHFIHSIPLAHSLSREPSADRYIRLLASNPLPLLIDKIIREASCLGVTRELERDFLAASLLTDVNLQLAEADAKNRRGTDEKTPLSSSNCIGVILGILGGRWTFMELCCTNVEHKS